ncbi:MAG: PQQ-binding-like beta-propeller repeat protein [bacterium]
MHKFFSGILPYVGVFVMTAAAAPVPAVELPASHPGNIVYDKHCASCHDNPEATRSRSFATLQRMIPALIAHAINDGRMKEQAKALTAEERADLIDFFTGQTRDDNLWVGEHLCDAADQPLALEEHATISGFGLGLQNHRYLSAAQSGLSTEDLSRLELKWALAFPNITMMRSQPAIVGNILFLTPVDSQQLYAIDISGQPCVRWVYDSDMPLRTSLTYGQIKHPQSSPAGSATIPALVFGDSAGRIHLLDARTGAALWRKSLKLFPETIITGTPQLVDGVVYASISQFEIMVGAQSTHLCCRSHGAVAALDAATGDTLWLTHAMPDAQPIRDRGDGQMIWGPSGAPIWTSPAIDLKRGLLYVGTGEATSEPAHPHTDAILAMDLKTGEIRWAFQATANDIFLAGCRRENRSPNCPPETSVERDVDFGASVIIAQRSNGKDVLLAGQKSSDVWALDPDNNGAVLWHWNNGRGTANGGIHWGMAYDGKRVFAGLNDPGRPRPGFEPQPGLYAIDVDSGESVWRHRTQPACAGRQEKMPYCEFLYGFSAATLAVDGAVIQGSLDGFVRIFAGDTGEVLWTYDTVQAFAGANGVSGHGGAIDNASIVAANGMLFVSSGYGMFGQAPGNVLLAFAPGESATQ